MKINIIHIYGFSEKYQKVFSVAFNDREQNEYYHEKNTFAKPLVGEISMTQRYL